MVAADLAELVDASVAGGAPLDRRTLLAVLDLLTEARKEFGPLSAASVTTVQHRIARLLRETSTHG